MEKLTSESIAPYLPYALYGFAEDRKRADKLLGIYGTGGHSLTMCCRVNNHNTVDYGCDIENLKPILRPMDLTKPIIVEGKEVVPIVELAKIAYNTEWYYKTGNYNAVSSAEVHGFEYNETGFEMYNQISGGFLPVKNQHALFQWLAKHKFDFMRLIEKGLAIDCNTLEINPYV